MPKKIWDVLPSLKMFFFKLLQTNTQRLNPFSEAFQLQQIKNMNIKRFWWEYPNTSVQEKQGRAFFSDGVKEWEQTPNEVFNGMGKLKRPQLHSALSQSGRWWRRGKYSFFKEVEVKKNALQTPPCCSPKLHVYTPVMANGLLNAQMKTKPGEVKESRHSSKRWE